MTVSQEEFREVKGSISADDRGRVNLGLSAAKKDYAVHVNDKGQVLLTPVVHIPEHEMWLFRNPVALQLVQTGLLQAARGEVTILDLSEYQHLATEDLEAED